jgi:hypothetical protein
MCSPYHRHMCSHQEEGPSQSMCCCCWQVLGMGLESSSRSLQAQQSANPVSGSMSYERAKTPHNVCECLAMPTRLEKLGCMHMYHKARAVTGGACVPNHPSCHLTFTDAARPAVARQASTVKTCEGCGPVKAGAIGVGNGSSNSTGVCSALIQVCRQCNKHSRRKVSWPQTLY